MKELLKLVQSVMREERWREAIELLKENSYVVEKHWELLWNLGWCHFKLERMDEARKYLTKAAQLAPENHVCKYGLASLSEKTAVQESRADSLRSAPNQRVSRSTHRFGVSLPRARKD